MTDIKLKTIKGFEWRGAYAPPRSDIEASELDARELLRNGLVEDYTVKAAESPENKSAPDPENKSAPKPSTKKKAE
ncbi:hypothetical protein IMF27_28240 [Pseudomonas sp. PCH199]|uniref:hypothetical protein n=1 Tax=unclassified Pseudomonas TaxID=196821 RepID=UPI000BD749D7|nr:MULTISPECIES: hypothetical protein [unclassified Pseudomonas]MCW8278922.1 hypothetical protein [Pseudomonas sp. PCH199]PAM79755.1 hypothetical protein CES87_28900 [Pseudomonas sp. ERMR1:02]